MLVQLIRDINGDRTPHAYIQSFQSGLQQQMLRCVFASVAMKHEVNSNGSFNVEIAPQGLPT